MPDLNYEVRNAQAEKALRQIADVLKVGVPPGMGFTLLLNQFGDSGNTFYVSNCNRDDMIKVLENMIVRLKGN